MAAAVAEEPGAVAEDYVDDDFEASDEEGEIEYKDSFVEDDADDAVEDDAVAPESPARAHLGAMPSVDDTTGEGAPVDSPAEAAAAAAKLAAEAAAAAKAAADEAAFAAREAELAKLAEQQAARGKAEQEEAAAKAAEAEAKAAEEVAAVAAAEAEAEAEAAAKVAAVPAPEPEPELSIELPFESEMPLPPPPPPQVAYVDTPDANLCRAAFRSKLSRKADGNFNVEGMFDRVNNNSHGSAGGSHVPTPGKINVDTDEELDLTEFQNFMKKQPVFKEGKLPISAMEDVFYLISGGDGQISMKDFEQFLHESAEHAEAAATAVTKEASTELPEGRAYAKKASEIRKVPEQMSELAKLESKHLTDLNPKEFGWKAQAAAGTEEDRTVWCGGIPADHPRLSELELRRFFANGFGAVENVKLRTKTSQTMSTGQVVGNHNGSWCLVTFVSMAAATKCLEHGVDIDVGLETREGCSLMVRKSEIRQHLQKSSSSRDISSNGSFKGEQGALQHIVGNNQLAFSHDLVQVLSTAKDNYDDGSFEVAAVSLTNAIEFSISRVDSTADLQSKERVALGACFALRGQCYEELGGPGSRSKAAQDYTAAIELDGDGGDEYEHDIEIPHQSSEQNPADYEMVPERVAPPSLPTPKPAPPKTPPKSGPMKGNPGQKRAASKGGSKNSGRGNGIGSVVGSHTPAFHPLTATHGRYPRVPMAMMPPSPRAAKTQQAAQAARMNGNGGGMSTDRPIAPPRPEVQAGWDRPSTAPAHKRGTFGTSYTVPRLPSDNHMGWDDEPRMKTPPATAGKVEMSAEQVEAERRAAAMARLFPSPTGDFKAPALKGRNMKEAAMNLPDGHFAVGGRVYKISNSTEATAEEGAAEQLQQQQQQQLPMPQAEEGEAMKEFLAQKQPDAVPPWMLHPDAKGGAAAKASTSRPGTAPDSAARRKAYVKKQQARGAQGRRQQLGAFGSGRGAEAGAGGRPWSPAEPRATVDLRAMTKPAAVNRQQVERSGWMWRPFSQGGSIVAAFGDDGKVAAVVPATTRAYADSLRRGKPGTPGSRGVTPRQGARAASARGASRNSARGSKPKTAMEVKLDEAVDVKGADARVAPSAAPEPATAQAAVEEPVEEAVADEVEG